MIGDRYLTDIVFGNRNGLLSVRVAPIELRGETAAVSLVRARLAGLCFPVATTQNIWKSRADFDIEWQQAQV